MEKKIPKKSNRTASRIIDNEAVVVIPEENIVNVLNKTGTRIWDLVDGERNLDEIATIIASEFGITYEEAYQDLMEFIKDLVDKGMMELSK